MSLEKNQTFVALCWLDNRPSDTSLIRLDLHNDIQSFRIRTLSQSLGMLVTHGFTQEMRQAIAMASIWENQFAIDNAVNFSLVYASVGFICAFIVGFHLARLAHQKRDESK